MEPNIQSNGLHLADVVTRTHARIIAITLQIT